jgi:hypothetical protein
MAISISNIFSKFTKQKDPVPKTSQKEVLDKVTDDLIPIESNIKAGGTQIVSYEKDVQVTVGSVVNTFPCIRKDVSGEYRPKSVDIDSKGSFVKNEPVMYTEEVENTRFPCGTYSINATNKLEINSGAGGAGLNTAGNMKIGSGGRTLIAAKEEMNISAGNGNVNIRAGNNISLKSDSLNLETPNQVVVNSNLGVSKNAIINGCAFVDGELYVQHITCPAEVQYTGGGIGAFGQLMTRSGINGDNVGNGGTAIIGYVDLSYLKALYNSIDVDISGLASGRIVKSSWSLPDKLAVKVLPDIGIGVTDGKTTRVSSNPEYSIYVMPHSHPFNNVPITFTDGNESLRSAASKLNSGEMGLASNIEHGYKAIGKTLPGTI